MSSKVAVVTGANKGIGFAIVRGLCKRFDGDVYLTSRDVTRGDGAIDALNFEGLNPQYHQLDVTDKESLETFRNHIEGRYGGIDLLINNAAMAFKHDAPDPVAVQAEQTLFVNYFSLVSTCDVLFPILKRGAKVINITSSLGHLKYIPSEKLRKQLQDPSLTVAELSALMRKYVDAAKEGTQAEEWGNSSYSVSKVGVTALTMIQQRLLSSKSIVVNAVHPGYVDTDMTSHKGPLTIDQGAEAPLFAAINLQQSLPGQYVWCTKQIVDWNGEQPSLH